MKENINILNGMIDQIKPGSGKKATSSGKEQNVMVGYILQRNKEKTVT